MIDSFRDNYFFLSNFRPCWVVLDGKRYQSVEHAYQAAKTLNEQEREQIRLASSPGVAKRLGRVCTHRKDWKSIKVSIMTDLVRQKFLRNPDLANKLILTGEEELIEGNTWGDRFWGVYRGRGENNLGKILMQVRGELNKDEKISNAENRL
jgi:ribA/ribD-fused uncharacterized protein